MDGISVTRRFQRILRNAGPPRQRFHDLRHAAASLLLAQEALKYAVGYADECRYVGDSTLDLMWRIDFKTRGRFTCTKKIRRGYRNAR